MFYYGLIVLIVIALNEMAKRLKIINVKFIPVSNIVLCTCLFLAYSGYDINRSLIAGGFLGVFTTGIFSMVKNILEALRQ